MAKYRTIDETDNCLLTLKALADEKRLRALMALRAHELCHCQIVELLELAPSTVSKHLAQLRQVNLIETRKVGRWIHFRASKLDNSEFSNQLSELISKQTKSSKIIIADRKRIKEILRMDPERLCESQRKRH